MVPRPRRSSGGLLAAPCWQFFVFLSAIFLIYCSSTTSRYHSCHAFVTSPSSRQGSTPAQQLVPRSGRPAMLPRVAAPTSRTPSSTIDATGPSSSTALHVVAPDASASASTMLDSMTSSPLWTYFWQTVISNGVPAAFAILVIGFTALQFRRGDSDERRRQGDADATNNLALLYDDLYGDQDQDPLKKNMPFFFPRDNNKKGELPKNTGVPKLQYFKITNLNQKYDSFQYSLTAASQSKAAAAAQYRQRAWERAMGKALASVADPSLAQKLQTLEREFLDRARHLQADLQNYETALAQRTVDQELKRMGMESVYQLDAAAAAPASLPSSNATAATGNSTTNMPSSSKASSSSGGGATPPPRLGEWVTTQQELKKLELDFVQSVVALVGPEHAAAVRTALLGGGSGSTATSSLLLHGGERPLSRLLGGSGGARPRLFVTRFPGDATASQVADLRETVTGVVRSAGPRDECLVVLQTGGGTVTGYGLAAAQLLRLKEAGLRLTIAVEQVAASGGYMMCCVGDRIVASPFAVLGSIGVISDIPNLYERLKQEGIEFQTVTAGKYKRTLTPTKKVTKEDFMKSKQDVEEILVLFRDFVAQNRPQLDIEKVATGETWFGTAALERNLCDEIKTVDDVVTEYIDDGFDVLELEYKPPVPETALGRLLPATGATANVGESAIQWLVRTVAKAVKNELADGATSSLNIPVQERYRAQDDSADRVRSQD